MLLLLVLLSVFATGGVLVVSPAIDDDAVALLLLLLSLPRLDEHTDDSCTFPQERVLGATNPTDKATRL